MPKKLSEILERKLYNPNMKYYPGIPGEQKFYDAHEKNSVVFKNIYSTAEYDPLFKGTNVKTSEREPRHGHSTPNDAKAYNSVNTTRPLDSNSKRGIFPEETIHEAKRNSKDHPEVHKDYEAYKKMSTNELLKHHKAQNRVSHNYSAADAGGKQGLISSILHAKHGRKRVAGYFGLKEDIEQIDELSRKRLAGYLKKSHDQQITSIAKAASGSSGYDDKKYRKRVKGGQAALKRLAKEEAEQQLEAHHILVNGKDGYGKFDSHEEAKKNVPRVKKLLRQAGFHDAAKKVTIVKENLITELQHGSLYFHKTHGLIKYKGKNEKGDHIFHSSKKASWPIKVSAADAKKLKKFDESINLTEASKLDPCNLVHHDGHSKSKAFATEYHKGHKANYTVGNEKENEKHWKNHDNFHQKYHEKMVESGFGGSGVYQYTNKKTGDVFHVHKVPNGKGFHGTDHIIHYRGQHEEN